MHSAPEFPEKIFLIRMLPLLAGVVLLGVGVLGKLALHPVFHDPSQLPRDVVSGSSLQIARFHYEETWRHTIQFPAVCRSRAQTLTEYERQLCMDFKTRLSFQMGLAAVPAVLGLLFFLGVRSQIRRRMLRGFELLVRASSGVIRGKVTEPVQAPQDGVSYFYCLQAIGVQVEQQKQLIAYLPYGSVLPLPGNDVTLVVWEKVFGSKRYLAKVHAPHMTIVRGE